MSFNLKNKKYFIRNKQYSEEDYFKEIQKINLGKYSNFKILLKEFYDMIKYKSIYKYANISKSINISGENIINSKNCKYCFGVHDAENSKYLIRAFNVKYSYDGYGVGGELVYDGVASGVNAYNELFYFLNTGAYNITYSGFCHSSSNLFGCIGLRNKQYCILNKQYTKEEYEELVPKIIKHMNDMPYIDKKGRVYKYGEFFPPELSPFCYNETIAQEYFPKTKEQALQEGYSWKEPEEKNIIPDIKTQDLPDHIKDVDDSIIGKIIQCEHSKINQDNTLEPTCNEMCTRGFKIIKEELQFYRRMNLPLPRLCPNCRHFQRLKQRNPLKLWKRTCQCQGKQGKNPNNPNIYQNQTIHFHGNSPCPNEFQTSYSPDRPEIVYCEECYNQEVV